MPEKISVLIVEPEKRPARAEIGKDLKSLQQAVDGLIECIYPYEEPVGLICNEEGKLLGLDLNRALRDDYGSIYDIVAGTFIIAGLSDDGDFRSLTEEEFKKFEHLFRQPEMFFRMPDGGIDVLSFDDIRDMPESTKQPRRTSIEGPELE